MKYNRHQRKLLQFCLLLAVLLLYQIVSLCAAETALNTTIERNSSPSASLLPPPDTTIYVHICDGVPYHFHGHTYESDSTETITLPGQASDGGDSIINLIVTEHPSPTISISANPNRPLCEGEDINITADCSCHIPIFDQSFSGLSNYWKYVLRIPCGDLCPYPDAPSPPGPPGVIISCNENAPDNVEISTRGYTLQYFPYITNVYAAGMSVKLGEELSTTTETWVGSMTSSTLDLSNPFKIIITAKGWGEEPGKITVCVDGIPQQSFYAIGNGWGSASDMYAEKILYFPAATSSSTITIKTDTIIKANGEITGYRAFIQRIQITRLCHHYSWSTGIADSNAIITVQPENNESYSVTVTNDNNCNASASYSVIVNHPLGTSDTISACNSYTWHDSTYMQSGTYYYTRLIADANGCYPVDTLHLTINDIPDAHISGNLNITEGHSTTLTVTPTGDQPYTYTWSASWSSGTSLSSPDTTNVFNTGVLNETTRYIVTVTDTNGCQDNDTATVNVSLCESWQLVTDASELAVGDKIVITNRTSNYALSTTQNSNYRGRVGISSNNNTITINDDVQIITLEQGNINNTYAFNVVGGYLFAASSTQNYLRTTNSINNNSSWNIQINNSNASIVAQGNNTNNILQYNSRDLFFSCYNQNSGQEPVKIYKRYAAVSCYIDTIACGMYEWYGHSYENTGVYKHNISNEDGCDTIITLHLTINPIPNAQINTNPVPAIICEGSSITLTGSTDCDGTEVILEEGFNGLFSSNNNITQNEWITSNHTFKAGNNKIWPLDNAIKIGSTTDFGYIISDDIILTHDFTVLCKAKNYSSSNTAKIKISFGNQDTTLILSQDYENYTHNYTGSMSHSIIKLETITKRAATIDSIAIYRNATCNYAWYTANADTFSRELSSGETQPNSTTRYYFSVTAPNGCVGVDSVEVVVVNETPATVTFNPGNGICNTPSLTEENCLSGITLPAATSCAPDYEFAGWTTAPVTSETTDTPNPFLSAGSNYNPSDNITLYAVYQQCETIDGPYIYQLVTSDTTDWSGEYLIAYTEQQKVWNETAHSDAEDAISVNIINHKIPFGSAPVYRFIIGNMGNGYYSIRDNNGYYMGKCSYNSRNCSNGNPVSNIIEYDNGNVNISVTAFPDYYITYRSDASVFGYYFRGFSYHYPIQLYRLIQDETIVTCTYTSYPFYPSASDTVEACDSYTWHRTSALDTTITNSGIYLHSYTEGGCVYVDTLKLTINRSTTGDTSAITCRSYTWHGHTYTESGDYNDTLTNALGCDSVVTLHLTIHNPTITFDDTDPLTACAGEDVVLHAYAHGNYEINYTWNFPDGHSLGWFDSLVIYNVNASDAGTYEVNASSTIFLSYSPLVYCMTSAVKSFTVTVNTPVHEHFSEVACESYTWHWLGGGDTTYTESGDYTHSHEDINGCTQVDTLHLTINRSIVVDTTVVACDSFSWHGNTYMWSGNYSDTLTNTTGCDSVVTLHLTVNESPELSITATADTICAGESDTLWVMRSIVPLVAVGDIFCTDNSFVKPVDWPVEGKTAQGIVFYVDNTGQHGWAVHLQEQDFYKWADTTTTGCYTDISTLSNFATARDAIADLDGYSNTQRIREDGDAVTYPAAYAVDFDHGWYLPAAGQLRLLYAELYNIYESFGIVNGDPLVITNDSGWYWSSTENTSGKACFVEYTFGNVSIINKTFRMRVRSIKNF